MAIKRTHEEFVELLKIKNSNIEVLGKYENAKTKIKCKCKIDLYEWDAIPDHLLNRNSGCPKCATKKRNQSHKKKTHNQFIEECKEKNPNIEILSKYNGVLNTIKCKCKICGGIFEKEACRIIEGRGCPICSGIEIYKGINDIATTCPEIVKYLKNKSDAYMYSKGSSSRIMFKCPNCNFEKELEINKVVKDKYFPCPKCSDGISYPNKFSRAFLDQLDINNIIYEYSPEWAKPYRYDNYFEYKGKKYILEMDGGFHYIKYYKSNLSLEDTKKIDSKKIL